jgi:hypothetical protein
MVDPNDIVPDSVRLHIQEVQRDAAAMPAASTESTGVDSPPTRGTSLRTLRERLGGDEGTILGPEGKPHSISLKQWANADPDETFISVRFSYQRRSLIGKKRPEP